MIHMQPSISSSEENTLATFKDYPSRAVFPERLLSREASLGKDMHEDLYTKRVPKVKVRCDWPVELSRCQVYSLCIEF